MDEAQEHEQKEHPCQVQICLMPDTWGGEQSIKI